MPKLIKEKTVGEIRAEIKYVSEVSIISIVANISLDKLLQKIREECRLSHEQNYTIKWVDEEGYYCTISSQMELEEAIRLCESNRTPELTIHVFPNVPFQLEMQCQKDEGIICRRPQPWKQLYRIKGHTFEGKGINLPFVVVNLSCSICKDPIRGLGLHGFKCIQCKLLVHKECYKTINTPCIGNLQKNSQRVERTGHLNGTLQNNIAKDIRTSAQTPLDVLGNRKPVDRYTVDDFHFIRMIGAGAYAKVFMAQLKTTKRVYAVKVAKKALLGGKWVHSERRVFEMAADCPFLVGLHSCFQTYTRLFYVMEFVCGGDFMYRMQYFKKFPECHVRFYAAEISLALNFLHCKGFIYRDLKLENVLLDHMGHVKLTDYGLCKGGIGPGDTTYTLCGTPSYMAPEILRGEGYGFSVDWWALGVLLFEMLIGEPPFQAAAGLEIPGRNSQDDLFDAILENTVHIPNSLSTKATSLLTELLNKNPADRLGCRGPEAFAEITGHQFFKCIRWNVLKGKHIPPPYTAHLSTERDWADFPPIVMEELIKLNLDDCLTLEEIDQSAFEGFDYVNPNI